MNIMIIESSSEAIKKIFDIINKHHVNAGILSETFFNNPWEIRLQISRKGNKFNDLQYCAIGCTYL